MHRVLSTPYGSGSVLRRIEGKWVPWVWGSLCILTGDGGKIMCPQYDVNDQSDWSEAEKQKLITLAVHGELVTLKHSWERPGR